MLLSPFLALRVHPITVVPFTAKRLCSPMVSLLHNVVHKAMKVLNIVSPLALIIKEYQASCNHLLEFVIFCYLLFFLH